MENKATVYGSFWWPAIDKERFESICEKHNIVHKIKKHKVKEIIVLYMKTKDFSFIQKKLGWWSEEYKTSNKDW